MLHKPILWGKGYYTRNLIHATKPASAAQEISASQGIGKKTMIEAGVKHLTKEADINISVGENRGR